ncbi:DNA polymerase, partial [Salmonella enterica subsp. enterica serovar Cerro]|nr:DNA polymerase [Salmonella enterica subsp. enterica serovar Cerro]
MICSYAFDDEQVRVWDSTDGSRMPDELRKGLRRVQRGKAKLVMHNGLLFDRLLMRECWGVDIDPRNIIDTMICAFRHSLPGSLDALCQVLQVEEENAKDKRGKALIQRFCKPTPKNYKVRRYAKETHPGEWAEFLAYAKSDISAMREVYHSLPQWGNTEFENTVLAVDQRINDRGFYVDTALANAAIEAVKQHKIELQAEANAKWGAGLTGADFLPTLRNLAPGHEILNAQKSTLNDLLADDDLPDDARTIIEMRLGASSTASTKYNPLLLGLSADGRRRGCIQYGGASRTLRFAGKGFQPQNLARGYYDDDPEDKVTRMPGESERNYLLRKHALSTGIDMLLKGKAHWAYDVSKLTATTVRSCVIPTIGNKLLVADYSNVEGRGLAWLAGEKTALATFEAGLDIYCVTAGKMFGMEPDYIKKMRKDLRQIGKACELGLG